MSTWDYQYHIDMYRQYVFNKADKETYYFHEII